MDREQVVCTERSTEQTQAKKGRYPRSHEHERRADAAQP
jgi:hypothetical protein